MRFSEEGALNHLPYRVVLKTADSIPSRALRSRLFYRCVNTNMQSESVSVIGIDPYRVGRIEVESRIDDYFGSKTMVDVELPGQTQSSC